MIKLLNTFKDNILDAANIAVKEVFATSYIFELNNINFSIDYDEKTESPEVCLVDIEGTYGDENQVTSFKKFTLTLYNIKEYDLENKQYLRGVFFGKFQAIEELV